MRSHQGAVPATGVTRYELPRPVQGDLWVSLDGRRLVCGGSNGAIEVWDTHPPLRWPFALLAGAGAAAGVLALAKWRRRSASRVASAAG